MVLFKQISIKLRKIYSQVHFASKKALSKLPEDRTVFRLYESLSTPEDHNAHVLCYQCLSLIHMVAITAHIYPHTKY